MSSTIPAEINGIIIWECHSPWLAIYRVENFDDTDFKNFGEWMWKEIEHAKNYCFQRSFKPDLHIAQITVTQSGWDSLEIEELLCH